MAWTQSFRWSQIQAQLSRLCIPMCYYGQDTETTTHLLLHCPHHHCTRKTLFYNINQVSDTISRQSYSTITKILLFGDNRFWNKQIFTGVYNRVYFINREIQLSLIQVNRNDSIVSLLFYSWPMKHVCFRLITFFLTWKTWPTNFSVKL